MRKAILGWLLMLVFGGVAVAQPVAPRAIPYSMLGALNGVATLDATGRISTAQTSAIAAIQSRFAEPLAKNTGLLERYLLTDGSGTTLTDVSGNGNNATFGSVASLPTWAADGSLTWTGGTTSPIPVPTSGQQVQTYEVVVGNAVATAPDGSYPTPYYNTPIGIGSNAGVASVMQFTTTYGTQGTVLNQGYGTKFVGMNQRGGAGQFGYSGPGLDNGVHDFEVVNGLVYEDGVLLPFSGGGSPSLVANAVSGTGYQIGGSLFGGQYPCTAALCGFAGNIYGASFSSTAETAAQVYQDHMAWLALEAKKGVNLGPSYATIAPFTLESFGESWTFGHGQSSPSTTNWTTLAATELSTALGITVNPIVDGNDSNNGYLMANACLAKINGLAATGGPKAMVFYPNGNSARTALGALPGNAFWQSLPPTAQGQALSDVAGLNKCASQAKAAGYYTILGLANSGGTTGQNEDATVKDIYNPLVRQFAKSFDAIWNTNDPRFDSDGASVSGYNGALATSCNGGPSFNSDNIHPPACGYSVLAQQLSALIAYGVVNAPYPPESFSSGTPAQGILDIGRPVTLSGSVTSYTLNPVGGFMPGILFSTITNATSSAISIIGGTEYNGGALDLITAGASAANAYSLAAGATKRFYVNYSGDATAVGGLTAQ